MIATTTAQPVAQLTVQREIAATAEELFDAFLDAESLGEFMRPGSERHSDVTCDPRVGGAFSIGMHVKDSIVAHTGTYLEIDRPRKLVFTWISKNTNHEESVVTVCFNALPGSTPRTDVLLTHLRLPESQVKGHLGGWTAIIELLQQRFSTPR